MEMLAVTLLDGLDPPEGEGLPLSEEVLQAVRGALRDTRGEPEAESTALALLESWEVRVRLGEGERLGERVGVVEGDELGVGLVEIEALRVLLGELEAAGEAVRVLSALVGFEEGDAKTVMELQAEAVVEKEAELLELLLCSALELLLI